MNEHPHFQQLRDHLGTVLTTRRITSFDDLVVVSRRPARSVLLMLNDMIARGEVSASTSNLAGTSESIRSPLPSIGRWTSPEPWGDLERRYAAISRKRDRPALLWGQRWLTPESAVERAHYVLSWLPQTTGQAIFLGDDDLVGPLVAALAPGWTVHIADIDRAVLEIAKAMAASQGARIITHHLDLSQAVLDFDDGCDIVVCDPNPSADGSSEGVFWSQAAAILHSGGTLITTSSPSHKPVHYGAGALRALAERDLHVVDLRTDFGRYELFDFDLVLAERDMLASHGLQCRIHHTKSLLAARRGRQPATSVPAAFDFDGWTRAASSHYLTVQAGQNDQEQIARRRAPSTPSSTQDEMNTPGRSGLRVDLIATDLEPLVSQINHGTKPAAIVDTAARILRRRGAAASTEEILELLRLANDSQIPEDGLLAPLGLALRALDSWERRVLHA
jgi:hypothetical protein